jgi:hypothetical protein
MRGQLYESRSTKRLLQTFAKSHGLAGDPKAFGARNDKGKGRMTGSASKKE